MAALSGVWTRESENREACNIPRLREARSGPGISGSGPQDSGAHSSFSVSNGQCCDNSTTGTSSCSGGDHKIKQSCGAIGTMAVVCVHTKFGSPALLTTDAAEPILDAVCFLVGAAEPILDAVCFLVGKGISKLTVGWSGQCAERCRESLRPLESPIGGYRYPSRGRPSNERKKLYRHRSPGKF